MRRFSFILGVLFLCLSGCVSTQTIDVDLIAPDNPSNITACSSYIRYEKSQKLADYAWIEIHAHGQENELSEFPIYFTVQFLVHEGAQIELLDNYVQLHDRTSDKWAQLQMRVINYIGAASEPCLACKKPLIPGFKMKGAIFDTNKLATGGIKKYEARVFSAGLSIPEKTGDRFSLKFADLKINDELVKVRKFHFERKNYTLPNGRCFNPW